MNVKTFLILLAISAIGYALLYLLGPFIAPFNAVIWFIMIFGAAAIGSWKANN